MTRGPLRQNPDITKAFNDFAVNFLLKGKGGVSEYERNQAFHKLVDRAIAEDGVDCILSYEGKFELSVISCALLFELFDCVFNLLKENALVHHRTQENEAELSAAVDNDSDDEEYLIVDCVEDASEFDVTDDVKNIRELDFISEILNQIGIYETDRHVDLITHIVSLCDTPLTDEAKFVLMQKIMWLIGYAAQGSAESPKAGVDLFNLALKNKKFQANLSDSWKSEKDISIPLFMAPFFMPLFQPYLKQTDKYYTGSICLSEKIDLFIGVGCSSQMILETLSSIMLQSLHQGDQFVYKSINIDKSSLETLLLKKGAVFTRDMIKKWDDYIKHDALPSHGVEFFSTVGSMSYSIFIDAIKEASDKIVQSDANRNISTL